MPNENPSLNRRWLQVDGLPPSFEHSLTRREIDRATRAEMTPTNRVVLFEGDEVLAAVDFSTVAKRRILAGIANHTPDQVSQPAKPPEPGDTVIRPIDLNDPAHAALLKSGPRFAADATEIPPLELPDYERPADERSEPNPAGDAVKDAIRANHQITLLHELIERHETRRVWDFATGAGFGAFIAALACAFIF